MVTSANARTNWMELRNTLYTVAIGFPAMLVAVLFKDGLAALGSIGFVIDILLAGVGVWTLVSFYRLCRSVTSWHILWFILLFVPILGLVILVAVVYLGFRRLRALQAQ